jgi:predicted RecA/RadA family phage recombinase
MSAATENLETPRKDGKLLAIGVAADDVVYRNILVVSDDTTGLLEHATAASSKRFEGVSQDFVDNTDGAAGARKCQVYRDGVFQFNTTGTEPKRGQDLFVADDNTVQLATTGALIRVGVADSDGDSGKVWVRIDVGSGSSSSSGQKVVGDLASVTGQLIVATGLSSIKAATATLAVAADSAAGDTVDVSFSGGNLTINVGKRTAANNNAIIPATAAKSVSWIAFGT